MNGTAKPRIVSVSRRTDVAAFFSPWFFRRLDDGFCRWFNPFNSRQMEISLKPEDVGGFVFWTRYPAPMLPRLAELDSRGFRYYFHVTINGYGREFEPRNPELGRAIDSFRRLSAATSPERTHWRYDPVILSNVTDASYHERRFESLARALAGYTRRCYFSFLDVYGKTRRNLISLERRGGPALSGESTGDRAEVALRLRDIAGECGITMYACCEDALVGRGIEKAHCADPELIGISEPYGPKPTRAECGCAESVDIGAYDTCRFGCVYCYATNSFEAAAKRASAHDPTDAAMWMPHSAAIVGETPDAT